MDAWLSPLALMAVASALVMVRARRPVTASVALGVHGLSLALLLIALSTPFVALMGAVLGVGVVLVRVLSRHERAHAAALSFALWPLVREGGLLCLVLLCWWLLRRPTFIEGLVEAEARASATATEVLVLLYTRYGGALLGVGLTLLAAVMGVAEQRRDR